MKAGLETVKNVVRNVLTFVLWILKEFLTMPVKIINGGGWPKYIFIFIHIFVAMKVLSDVYGALEAVIAPIPTIPELVPDQSLRYVRDYTSARAPAVMLSKEGAEEVREEMTKQAKYCAMLSSEQRRWCESFTNFDVLTAYNKFRDLKKEYCWENANSNNWIETKNFQLRYYELDEDSYYNYSPTKDMPEYGVTYSMQSGAIRGKFNADPALGEHGKPWMNFQWGNYDHGYTKQTCKFKAEPEERGNWYVERVGPFTNRNIGSWHNIWWNAFEDFQDELEANYVSSYITGSLVSVVDKYHNIIPFPPLHYHHFQLFFVDPLQQIWPRSVSLEAETLGDDMCAHKGLGPLCYMKWLPPGWGVNAAPRYFVDSLINFVTPPHLEDDQEFWFEVAIALTDNKRVKIEPMTVLPFMTKDYYGFMPADSGTYTVPRGTDSMVWDTVEMPLSVDLLWWKWHARYDYTSEIWIVEGDGKEIFGFDQDPYIKYVVPMTPDDVEGARDDPSGDPMKEFHNDIDAYAKMRIIVPSETALPVKARYLDLKATPMNNIEKAKQDLMQRFHAYNKRQHDINGKESQFIFKADEFEQFHSPVGDDKEHLWTHRPLSIPTRSSFNKGEKFTVVAFHRSVPHICGDNCEDSKQQVRLHTILRAEVAVRDPVVRFLLGRTGRRITYYAHYYGLIILTFFFLLLTFLIFGSISLYRQGKCVPTSGPCAFGKPPVVYKRVAVDDKEVEATLNKSIDSNKIHRVL